MAEDTFETVAIVYSLPEAAALLALFAQYDIATDVVGARHAAVNPVLMVALGGIVVRVQADALGEAHALLAEIAARPQAVRPRLIDHVVLNAVIVLCAFVIGIAPAPPTRVGSTFLLGNVRRQGDQPQA